MKVLSRLCFNPLNLIQSLNCTIEYLSLGGEGVKTGVSHFLSQLEQSGRSLRSNLSLANQTVSTTLQCIVYVKDLCCLDQIGFQVIVLHSLEGQANPACTINV